MPSRKEEDEKRKSIHISLSYENYKWILSKTEKKDSIFLKNKSLLMDFCLNFIRVCDSKEFISQLDQIDNPDVVPSIRSALIVLNGGVASG